MRDIEALLGPDGRVPVGEGPAPRWGRSAAGGAGEDLAAVGEQTGRGEPRTGERGQGQSGVAGRVVTNNQGSSWPIAQVATTCIARQPACLNTVNTVNTVRGTSPVPAGALAGVVPPVQVVPGVGTRSCRVWGRGRARCGD